MTAKAAWEQAETNAEGFRELGPRELRDVGAMRIVDVREPHEFEAELGHIRGAELVPLATLEAAQRGWKRDEVLALVCRSGSRSRKAAALLVAQGFSRVINVRGGMLEHNALGLPVCRSEAP